MILSENVWFVSSSQLQLGKNLDGSLWWVVRAIKNLLTMRSLWRHEKRFILVSNTSKAMFQILTKTTTTNYFCFVSLCGRGCLQFKSYLKPSFTYCVDLLANLIPIQISYINNHEWNNTHCLILNKLMKSNEKYLDIRRGSEMKHIKHYRAIGM